MLMRRTISRTHAKRGIPLGRRYRDYENLGSTRVRMTCPMVHRHEVEVRGKVERVTPWVHNVLVVLLMNRGRFLTVDDLIPCVWPDPDQEPDFAADLVRKAICYMRDIHIRVLVVKGHGYQIPITRPGDM